MEPTVEAYYASGRKKIIKVAANDDFTLTLAFENGEQRLYSALPLIQQGTVFAPLRNWDVFRRVYLDNQHCVSWDIDPSVDSNIVWSNKIDLCPDSCYIDSIPIDEQLWVSEEGEYEREQMEFAYYCLENYKIFKSLTGEQVYHLFIKNGVFDYLKEFYDVLHTTGHKYIVNDIDLFLKSRGISV